MRNYNFKAGKIVSLILGVLMFVIYLYMGSDNTTFCYKWFFLFGAMMFIATFIAIKILEEINID